MKKLLKNFLKKAGWYERLKYSGIFGIYERLFKPGIQQAHLREVALYLSFLDNCALIFDIGAYDGHKTAAFLRISEKVVSCEPDPYNFRVLNLRFRHKRNRVFPEQVALSDKEGEAIFYIHHQGSAFNTLNPKWKKILEEQGLQRWSEAIRFTGQPIRTPATTLDRLIAKHGKPDFIKIDAEGWEIFVIRGLTQKVSCLSFETLLPEFREELMQCIDHLLKIDPSATFNIIRDDKLFLEKFTSRAGLLANIEQLPGSFEVVVKMDQ